MKSKNLKFLLVSVLVFPLFTYEYIYAKNFDGIENEMNKKCSIINTIEIQKECLEYQKYLENKSNDLESEMLDIQKSIDSVQGDVEKISQLIKSNNLSIQNYTNQIADLESNIATIQNTINTLNQQIEEKNNNIIKRDEFIKKMMISNQSSIGINQYINFIMGADNFINLIRRINVMSEISEYEHEEITKINKEKKELNKSKTDVENKKELLEIQIKNIAVNKEKMEFLNNANEILLISFQQKESALVEQKRTIQMSQTNLPKIDISIGTSFDSPTFPEQPSDNNDTESPNNPNQPVIPTPPSSNSFISPLQYGWYYFSGTWQYPGGGGHMGIDFSTGLQTGIPVVAPNDGVIIYSYNGGCNNNGYSACGIPWGGGNNTLLLTKKDNIIYAMPFYHLTSATKTAGNIVKQGEIIGYSGNSGNSTGPHTHVEIIRVGNMSMTEAINLYNQTRDLTFGTGWNADLPKICGTAPCRERPENYWL